MNHLHHHVNHLLVVLTLFAMKEMVLAHVNACPNTMEIRTMNVARNVLWTAIALLIALVSITNALIHVQERAAKTPNVKLSITRPYALVGTVIPETHWLLAIQGQVRIECSMSASAVSSKSIHFHNIFVRSRGWYANCPSRSLHSIAVRPQ